MSDQEQPESSTDKSNEVENTTRQFKMPQDIRYSTEQDDRDKLMKKYENYQISDSNLCIVRFLVDHRQKRKLFNLQAIEKTFDVNLSPKDRTSSKFSFKLIGTEANVRTCLIDILNRIFKRSNRSSTQTNSEVDDHTEKHDESYKYIPLALEPEHKFIILITSQGQEILKKNWNSFTGSLQQRLNVTVMNPFRLPKFGDAQSQHELSITGHAHENLVDAALQIIAFINDILDVVIQPYKSKQNSVDEQTITNGIYEQIILIRRDCIARIIGTHGSTKKRIQSKCHLRDMYIARHANENGYTECKISAYQVENLNFAIDTIKSYLRNENQQAIQVFDSYYVDVAEYQPEQTLLTIPSNFNHDNQSVQSSYNFQSTPTFDFTHQPTCASRENDKRSDNLNDSSSVSSSNSCSRHRSKRTCPVTKEIECSTDDGFWIRKQYYHALDDQSKELFDSLMKKFEEIRLANEGNSVKKQRQRLVGRNRTNKLRTIASDNKK